MTRWILMLTHSKVWIFRIKGKWIGEYSEYTLPSPTPLVGASGFSRLFRHDCNRQILFPFCGLYAAGFPFLVNVAKSMKQYLKLLHVLQIIPSNRWQSLEWKEGFYQHFTQYFQTPTTAIIIEANLLTYVFSSLSVSLTIFTLKPFYHQGWKVTKKKV